MMASVGMLGRLIAPILVTHHEPGSPRTKLKFCSMLSSFFKGARKKLGTKALAGPSTRYLQRSKHRRN
jgi:hypothetical protein